MVLHGLPERIEVGRIRRLVEKTATGTFLHGRLRPGLHLGYLRRLFPVMGRYGRLPFRTLAYLLRFGSLRPHRGCGCGYLLGVFVIAFEAEIPSEILPEHLL